MDKIFSECLKYAKCDELLEKITQLMYKVWDGVKKPDVWKLSRVKCMWKRKGSKQDATRYRGLSVGAITSKVLPLILLNKIKPVYEDMVSPNQYGSCRQHSTMDGIYILKNLIERSSMPFVAMFIDLKAAYNWVPRDCLIKVFKYRTGASKIAKMLSEGFANTQGPHNRI